MVDSGLLSPAESRKARALVRELTGSHTASRVVCVLGMHRSGTSCLAGSLQLAGLYAGNVNQRAANNRRGNREELSIRDLHDDVLHTSGGAWDQPPRQLAWTDEQSRRRDELIGGFARRSPVWMFKDPRSLLLLQFWDEGAVEIIPVGIFRHPVNVALSLQARSSLAPARGLDLWNHYNQRLLGLHEQESFPLLSFDVGRDEWRSQIETTVDHLRRRVGEEVALSVEAAISFYAPELVHQGDDAQLPEAELADGGEDLAATLDRAEGIHSALRKRSLVGADSHASAVGLGAG